MNADQAVELARQTLQITLMICGPILLIAMGVGLLVSVFQVITSLQDTTVTTVPRLAAVAAVAFLLSPWMFREMVSFTVRLLGDFHPYLH
ncbi:MAG TPA: flagellar biosynthetic protein FliQ [Terriglobales bacterium]|nr:flagellar biosynthetic protein FliQ [Terriglobales bacterium]